MNSRSPLLRARRDSRSRPQERPRLSEESQASNESHMLWEGERAKRVLKNGPMQSTLDAKTVVFAESGHIVVVVHFFDDSGVYKRVPFVVDKLPFDLVEIHRLFCVIDALPEIDVEAEAMNRLVTGIKIAVQHADMAQDARYRGAYEAVQAAVGPERLTELVASWPTHLDRVVVTCQTEKVPLDLDALSKAMDAGMPVSSYLVRDCGVEHPDARRMRLAEEEVYLEQFQAPLAAVCQLLRKNQAQVVPTVRSFILQMREIGVTEPDLVVAFVANCLCQGDAQRQLLPTMLSSLMGAFGGDDFDIFTAMGMPSVDPLKIADEATDRAIEVTQKVVENCRHQRDLRWAMNGIGLDLIRHQKAKDDSQQ